MQQRFISPAVRSDADVALVAFRGEEVPENVLQATASLKTVNVIPAIGELAFLHLLSLFMFFFFTPYYAFAFDLLNSVICQNSNKLKVRDTIFIIVLEILSRLSTTSF